MCVWYLKVWPLSTWVPARQQVVGSPTLRDYLVLLLIFFFIGVGLWFTRMEFVSWRWCRLVFDFYILDGSYVTLLPWPVFPLICLRSDLIAWKIRFPVLSITASLHIIHPYADVQIDRVFQTLIIVCIIVSLQSVGLSYLGMVTCWRIIPRSLLPVAWCGFAKFYHY